MQEPFPQTSANGTNGQSKANSSVPVELDAAVIGGGFSGVYLLHRLRQAGYNAKIIEAGSALGGVWHWNTYPGARVDAQYPVYQLNIPEVYNTFTWSEQYPGTSELQAYFQHVDTVLDISKDTIFNTRVEGASWDDETQKWIVECDNGICIKASFFMCCLGFAAKRHFPAWPGLDSFAGELHHSSFWPEQGVDIKGKHVACIGSGATGVQIAQEWAKTANHLAVFIRTPNTCIPMRQRPIEKAQAKEDLEDIVPMIMEKRYHTISGFKYSNPTRKLTETPIKERDAILEDAWAKGGFRLTLAFTDILRDEVANRYVYDFWAQKVRRRITDPIKRDILAPLEPPHPFGGKRPSMEQDYYEQMDRTHVTIVNLKHNAISRIVPDGIVTEDGALHKAQVLALATGFDSLTGSFAQIRIRGVNGEDLEKKWSGEQGALSYLGLAVHNFPNMFYTYGPHSPTAYGNGPTVVEKQSEWILATLDRMQKNSEKVINAQEQPEQDWKKTVNEIHAATLRDRVDSWYMGSNIPGKPRQALNYAGGVERYINTINEKLQNGWEGFDIS